MAQTDGFGPLALRVLLSMGFTLLKATRNIPHPGLSWVAAQMNQIGCKPSRRSTPPDFP